MRQDKGMLKISFGTDYFVPLLDSSGYINDPALSVFMKAFLVLCFQTTPTTNREGSYRKTPLRWRRDSE